MVEFVTFRLVKYLCMIDDAMMGYAREEVGQEGEEWDGGSWADGGRVDAALCGPVGRGGGWVGNP